MQPNQDRHNRRTKHLHTHTTLTDNPNTCNYTHTTQVRPMHTYHIIPDSTTAFYCRPHPLTHTTILLQTTSSGCVQFGTGYTRFCIYSFQGNLLCLDRNRPCLGLDSLRHRQTSLAHDSPTRPPRMPGCTESSDQTPRPCPPGSDTDSYHSRSIHPCMLANQGSALQKRNILQTNHKGLHTRGYNTLFPYIVPPPHYNKKKT